MKPYQRQFLEAALTCEALRFGEFTLKSGRTSPYFFNAGRFDHGCALDTIGRCYAAALAEDGLAFDMLFGPAYKGLPLATALSVALWRDQGRDVPVAFNRKEAKDHGEGGTLIGAPPNGRVLIVDDVITAGTAIRESVALIRQAGGEPCGVVIALDRQERGQGDLSAADEVRRSLGLPVVAVAGLDDLLAFMDVREDLAAQRAAVADYRSRFGC
ncbi:orotate phosphoribosyltransferase [Pseudofulvimonas gallinarii]|jgi:orotate phosphoribosyltransferase|uniref:Orotate phosphoribosyltransferase n=1 Tax=Pseudofulvimonas gallinarii TaxID=634155 RepID=A0A4R3LKX2_9GAMM|nr:orotate phosphoribosyltransferase [Pseudofulvimonas gallinarii]TCS98426.1 orotate phosphoribosyltransferase [Pseudofulvimonas gallinarii]THD13768.1 orotate phosphoribosyltransferase [Pseudofulvimonas gallinarii]